MKLCAFADEAAKDLRGQIAAMQKNDISLLEIRGVDGENIKDISPAKAKEVRKMLNAAGIAVWSLGSPIGKYSLEKDFAPHLDDFCRTAELAEILGASHMRIFSFFPEKDADKERTKEEVLSRLIKICEKAPALLMLCHENEKEIFGEDIPACLAIHRALPRIRAVFDPANFVQCGVDTVQAWNALAPYIEYMHIKDARADGTVVLAGDGEGRVPLLLRKYADMGGDVLTLEPHLNNFIGLDKLENGKSVKSHSVYKTGGEAFDAAANRLKKLIFDIKKEF